MDLEIFLCARNMRPILSFLLRTGSGLSLGVPCAETQKRNLNSSVTLLNNKTHIVVNPTRSHRGLDLDQMSTLRNNHLNINLKNNLGSFLNGLELMVYNASQTHCSIYIPSYHIYKRRTSIRYRVHLMFLLPFLLWTCTFV